MTTERSTAWSSCFVFLGVIIIRILKYFLTFIWIFSRFGYWKFLTEIFHTSMIFKMPWCQCFVSFRVKMLSSCSSWFNARDRDIMPPTHTVPGLRQLRPTVTTKYPKLKVYKNVTWPLSYMYIDEFCGSWGIKGYMQIISIWQTG